MDQILKRGNGALLDPPRGLEQIIATFGDIFAYVHEDHTLDARWYADQLVTLALPFPIRLSWDHTRTAERLTCHRLLKTIFEATFADIQRADLQCQILSLGGCFSFRSQRTGTKLSTHSWGIAIDLNSETNQQGTPGDMDPAVVAIFKHAGFSWGGDWQGRASDPMHFQYCSGY